VFAFEPDPIAFKELDANVRANASHAWASRISIMNMAVAAMGGTVRLGSRADGGDSETSILFADHSTSWEVRATTLPDFVQAEHLEAEKIFVKMDIEGGEYELIPKLKGFFADRNVDLFLSIHPTFLMLRLTRGKRIGLFAKVLRRLYAVAHQVRLVRALPFKYRYRSDGRRVRIAHDALDALIFGHYLSEIVATNRPWPTAAQGATRQR
jgi:FkbM family methyltransferase